jgi:hypothetical protein
MKYNVERHDINVSGFYTEWWDRIEADSIEYAKLKAKKLFLMKGEILGDWFGNSGKLCAFISSPDRKLRNSGIVIFV